MEKSEDVAVRVKQESYRKQAVPSVRVQPAAILCDRLFQTITSVAVRASAMMALTRRL